MAIAVTCACGKSYELKDDLAGRLVQCPACGNQMRAAPPIPPVIHGDVAFARDKFLLRQKHLSINEKYFVWDEAGQAIFFIERPSHLLRSLACVSIIAFGIIISAIIGAVIGILIGDSGKMPLLGAIVGLLIGITGIAGAIVLGILVSAKRHVNFYRDDSRSEKLLEVLQDKKVNIPIATYTIRDNAGQVLALLRKNYLFDFFRKRWECSTPEGQCICLAQEDSIILSLMRRLMGPMLGLLRTNFVFTTADGGQVIGEFNRKFTLLDRYVLDMSADPQRTVDRRIALAIGVMLDTGERR